MCPLCTKGRGPKDYSAWALLKDLFCTLTTVCIVFTLHRIANGLLLGSRVTALQEVGAAYTPEERELLIHKIKRASLRC